MTQQYNFTKNIYFCNYSESKNINLLIFIKIKQQFFFKQLFVNWDVFQGYSIQFHVGNSTILQHLEIPPPLQNNGLE